MKAIPLRPCPFCGRKPKWERVVHVGLHCTSHVVVCRYIVCGVRPVTGLRDNRESAAACWNGEEAKK